MQCVMIRGKGTEGFAAGADTGEFTAMRSTREAGDSISRKHCA